MPDEIDDIGPGLRRRQLGRQLRDLRIAAGYETIQEAADKVGLSRATISRIENAKQVILPRTVRLMCQAYHVGAPMVDMLVRQAGESDERGWTVDYSDTTPAWFERYLGEESDAQEIWSYETELIPGLLQTEDYARSISAANQPTVTEESIRGMVALRQARQERLADSGRRLVAVINEGALHRQVGGAKVMRGQLRHLLDLAERPNITMQVLPFTAGAHPAKTAFAMLHFPASVGEPTVFVEVDSGALYPDRQADFDRYTWIFTRLRELSLSADETISLVSRLSGVNPGKKGGTGK